MTISEGITLSEKEAARLLELADKQELLELVVKYSSAADARDLEALREVFSDDSINYHGDNNQFSPEEFISYFANEISGLEHTTHYVPQALFKIDGDEATGEVYKVSYTRSKGPDAREMMWGSRSHDRYRRIDGEWKITERSTSLDWSRTNDYDAGTRPDIYSK